jgi:hypothetical protein
LWPKAAQAGVPGKALQMSAPPRVAALVGKTLQRFTRWSRSASEKKALAAVKLLLV